MDPTNQTHINNLDLKNISTTKRHCIANCFQNTAIVQMDKISKQLIHVKKKKNVVQKHHNWL